MAHHFGSLLFTPAIKALQERHGSRRTYERLAGADAGRDRLGDDERAFVGERDSFYLATVGEGGWPYIQHRGGPKGFLKTIDDRTLAFADFRGNKQFISAGNLAGDARVALILVDYPNRARLKVVGRAELVEGAAAAQLVEATRDPSYDATVERVFVIHVEAFDWNCPQHLTPRYTADEIREVLAPVERRLGELERENERLTAELARLTRK